MKKLLLSILLMAGGVSSINAQIIPDNQRYMFGSISFGQMSGLPSSKVMPGLSYQIGMSRYMTPNLFIDVALSGVMQSSRFKGEIHLNDGDFTDELDLYSFEVKMPVSLGISFMIYDTEQQVDILAGVYLSSGLFGSITASEYKGLLYTSIPPQGTTPMMKTVRISPYDFDENAITYTRRSNIGLQVQGRYWITSKAFIGAALSYDLLSRLQSGEILILEDKTYNNVSSYRSQILRCDVTAGFCF